MQKTGNTLASLTERMKQKTEESRQTAEQMTQEQFNALSKNLLKSSKAALNTTENAILQELMTLEENFSKRCQTVRRFLNINTGLTVLAIVAAIILGGIGITTYYQYQLKNLQEEIEVLTVKSNNLKNQLNLWEAKTWGLELHKAENGHFILLPKGTQIDQELWKMGNKNALRLITVGK